MSDPEIEQIRVFHAHIYYDPVRTREDAARVREELDARFDVRLGRWHDVEVGPHTQAMYQVVFTPEQFGEIVQWLILNRRGLDVLVHPDTGWPRRNHVEHGIWLGRQLPIKADRLGERDSG